MHWWAVSARGVIRSVVMVVAGPTGVLVLQGALGALSTPFFVGSFPLKTKHDKKGEDVKQLIRRRRPKIEDEMLREN